MLHANTIAVKVIKWLLAEIPKISKAIYYSFISDRGIVTKILT